MNIVIVLIVLCNLQVLHIWNARDSMAPAFPKASIVKRFNLLLAPYGIACENKGKVHIIRKFEFLEI